MREASRRAPGETRLRELLLYVLGFMAAVALLAFAAVWVLRRI